MPGTLYTSGPLENFQRWTCILSLHHRAPMHASSYRPSAATSDRRGSAEHHDSHLDMPILPRLARPAMVQRIAQLSVFHLQTDGQPNFEAIAAVISREASRQLVHAVEAGFWQPYCERLYPVKAPQVQEAWRIIWSSSDLGSLLGTTTSTAALGSGCPVPTAGSTGVAAGAGDGTLMQSSPPAQRPVLQSSTAVHTQDQAVGRGQPADSVHAVSESRQANAAPVPSQHAAVRTVQDSQVGDGLGSRIRHDQELLKQMQLKQLQVLKRKDMQHQGLQHQQQHTREPDRADLRKQQRHLQPQHHEAERRQNTHQMQQHKQLQQQQQQQHRRQQQQLLLLQQQRKQQQHWQFLQQQQLDKPLEQQRQPQHKQIQRLQQQQLPSHSVPATQRLGAAHSSIETDDALEDNEQRKRRRLTDNQQTGDQHSSVTSDGLTGASVAACSAPDKLNSPSRNDDVASPGNECNTSEPPVAAITSTSATAEGIVSYVALSAETAVDDVVVLDD